MSVGVYGITRPSDVSVNDIDVYYTYSQTRDVSTSEMFKIDATTIINQVNLPTNQQISGNENILEGLYNLKLPASIFNNLGIYTIYIKPKTITATITDCGVLSALPNIKGILLNTNGLDSNLIIDDALQGYRIEYINSDGTKLRNVVRYIVTSKLVIPVTENVGNTSQKATRYIFNNSGNLLFLQLTPASASNLKPNVLPFIGKPGQQILISNTFFNPVVFEIEMVENTLDSITDIIVGNQTKDVSNGILTYYNTNKDIIKQVDLFEIKDDVTNESLYEIKQLRENITPENFDDIVNSVNGI